MQNIKDKLSNILAIILFFAAALKTYFDANASKPFDWQGFSLFVVGIIISYLTGKNPNGTTKSDTQVANQNAQSKSTSTVIPVILLLIGLFIFVGNSKAQSTKYFFKSVKEIPAQKTLKASVGDVTTTPTSAWYFKLDGGLSLTRFQYVGGLEGVKVDAFKMAGLGVSYQKISQVNGQNYTDLTLKALIDFPTVDNQKMGICVGPVFWNNTISFVVGYTIGEAYPFLGVNGSWNF
jgi:hypothetical protein